jgi:hypothetical protein
MADPELRYYLRHGLAVQETQEPAPVPPPEPGTKNLTRRYEAPEQAVCKASLRASRSQSRLNPAAKSVCAWRIYSPVDRHRRADFRGTGWLGARYA